MDISFTSVSAMDVVLLLLAIAGIVLVIYLILFFKSLISTVKSVNMIVNDMETISNVASERTKQIDKAITNVSDTIKNSKGKKKESSFVGSLINVLLSIKKFVSKDKTKDDSCK